MSAKILKVVFVILLLVTIGELGYYVYVLKFNQPKPTKQLNPISATPSAEVPGSLDVSEKPELKLADVYQFFQDHKKNDEVKYYLLTEVSGVLGKVENIIAQSEKLRLR